MRYLFVALALSVVLSTPALARKQIVSASSPEGQTLQIFSWQPTASAAAAVQPHKKAPEPPPPTFNLFDNFAPFTPFTPFKPFVPTHDLLRTAETDLGKGNFTSFQSGPWCAAAIGEWLHRAGYRRLPSLAARDYAQYGKPAQPAPGVIAVMPHHIGIVQKMVAGGYIVLSGNHLNRVAYGFYKPSRIIAFRAPV